MLNTAPAILYDPPNSELSTMVQEAMLTIGVLLARYPVAVQTIDGNFQWIAALHKWREDLWLVAGYLAAAGFDPPWDLELEDQPTVFIVTWRALLAKVWPAIDPMRPDRLHRVQ
ncbi:hypothetical protein [Devosia sp. CN2-171]|uniref:hypothetical protein n=1 Tax=Devosia sp. CN2-171 TaxID=3400909 RepID=UPI003BF7C804